MGWRATLETLKPQFEAQATRSLGLHHMMVEVADDERDKMKGPDWFVREADFFGSNTTPVHPSGPWQVAQFSGLPWLGPHFRGVQPEESLDRIPPERIVCDKSGTPRAVFVPIRLRSSYLCGDTNASAAFLALAEAASRSLTGVAEFDGCSFTDELIDLFREPRGGIRQIFGEITDPPPQFIANGWNTGVLLYPSGVLIDTPLAEQVPDSAHWLLLLHQIAWCRLSGSPLRSQRLSWHENMTVPYEWVANREAEMSVPTMLREKLAQISTTSYYSVLGTREHPLDVNLASAFAIDLLLSKGPAAKNRPSQSAVPVDYSNESWHKLPMPQIVEANQTASALRKRVKPKVVLLTATPIERDTVLKHLEPLADSAGIIRLHHDKNTYFIGRLGKQPIVLCMCSTGAASRDSAQIVTGEALRFWKPSALIMVGIAFGRTEDRQKIGDALVSERIIAYEPERVGVELSIARGHHFQAGPKLFSAFRNADVDWRFDNPQGLPSTPHFGAVLSGEKLVDNPEFKSELFVKRRA
jgi:nucleoside phosphorylase